MLIYSYIYVSYDFNSIIYFFSRSEQKSFLNYPSFLIIWSNSIILKILFEKKFMLDYS